MNNIEKIIDRINSEADGRIEKIKLEANEECEKFKAETDEAAENACREIIDGAKADAERILERGEAAAQMEAKKYTLGIKQEIIARVFEKAVSDIISLPENEYAALLAKLAFESSETGNETLVFSPEDREKIGQKVTFAANELLKNAGKPGNLTLSEDTRPLRGGFILSGGRIETNCQIDAIVNSYKNELTMDIANILFE